MSISSASRSIALSAFTAAVVLAGVDFGMGTSFGSEWMEAGRTAIWPAAFAAAPAVNRAAKGDRDALPGMARDSVTLSFSLNGQRDMSVVMRLPTAPVARPEVGTTGTGTGSSQPAASSTPRRLIACEPTVSPLAAAAKMVGPGRCIT